MTDENSPFGGQLCAELKRLNRLDMITRKLDYAAIQRLKQSDRQQTLKLFQGSSYEFLQLIETREPTDVAACLIQQQQADAAAVACIMLMSNPVVG